MSSKTLHPTHHNHPLVVVDQHSQQFSAHHFRVNRSIQVGCNFNQHFLMGLGKAEQPSCAQILKVHMLEEEIPACLAFDCNLEITTLFGVYCLIMRSLGLKDNNGVLVTDGKKNSFCVLDQFNTPCVVSIFKHGIWYVDTMDVKSRDQSRMLMLNGKLFFPCRPVLC